MSTFPEFSLDIDEYIDDLGELNAPDFRETVVVSTDWTAETIIRQVAKGNIILDPNFQRRDAWTAAKKSLFIESILLNIPIPPLVLAESPYASGKYIVLDGKQRLLSILQFAGIDNREQFSSLKLRSMPILTAMNGETYESLLEKQANMSRFENNTIRTSIIKNAKNEDVLYQVFYRLNTGSLPLSAQELRFALHPGKFSEFLDEMSSNMSVFRYVFNAKKPDFRMRDAELLLRFLANYFFINHYEGNLKKFLDESFRKFSDDFESDGQEIINSVEQLELAHDFIVDSFGDCAYKKYKSERFETRFNRSVFEVWTYIFSDQTVRDIVAPHSDRLIDIFKEISDENPEYIDSFESSTKSPAATKIRFNYTIDAVNENFGTSINRIL